MQALRTPDERFAGLPNFPCAPRRLDDLRGFEGLRIHHVDEDALVSEVTEGFRQWRTYANSRPDLPEGGLFQRGKPSSARTPA